MLRGLHRNAGSSSPLAPVQFPNRLRRAWRIANACVCPAGTLDGLVRWQIVTGPIAALIATLLDYGIRPPPCVPRWFITLITLV